MLKLRDVQLTMWDAILLEAVRALPAELAIIDALLDDERFLQPFVKLHPKGKKSGRPTFAIEKYVRLMVLKHKYNLGYESLVKEVGDSITWRMFCRIAIDELMPDPSTLIYARKRYGNKIVEDVNAALVKQLEEKAILKTRKFRTDTTVVESDIHHPTDATLLQDGVKVMSRIIRKIRKVASHAVQGMEDRTLEIKEKILSIAKVLRRRTRESWEEVDKITQSVIEITENVVSQAHAVIEKLQNQRKTIVQQKKERLVTAVQLTEKLLDQARQVVSGNRIIADRMVSFFDPEARPIKKGKLAKGTEFGYKVRIDETESGFVTGYAVYEGNPSDDELLVPAIEEHIKQFGKAPQAVATDRGFSSKKNEIAMTELGVKRASLPKKGKKGAARTEYENEKWFKDLQRYRAAGEAKISLLKRKYGLNRSRYRGFAGSKCWIGFGILTHNLQRAAKMLQN
ncbi:ISNCY-like element ISAfer1 family transposase [Ferroacidibacillus organovorans]|uniref:Transposase n=1 Tax=Ferroacidibacillus organovorans TaxID=1765683 RepID=A0A853KCS9_9BACL|nr:ISNCY-like element ISAfer1 family transposase [Ferroacidibacillus organovorans]KYP81648.1 transposase [Ferroacidibacillus organovorans]OAG94154.1 transposase [Ferroacidibacillus organovorans]